MKIAYGLLAAGESRRFKSCKQLAIYKGKTLFDHAMDALKHDEQPVVVLGEYSESIRILGGANFIFNKEFKNGMGGSISALASHVQSKDYDALLIHLCDLPLIKQTDIQSLVDFYVMQPSLPVASQTQSTFGPPCIFPNTMFDKLIQLNSCQGAKHILKNSDCRFLEMPNAEFDIDTVDDLVELQTRSRLDWLS